MTCRPVLEALRVTDTCEAFGELLRDARTARGLSQAALAERAQLSENAVGALERGARRAPRKESVAALAQALGLDAAAELRLERAAEAARRRGARASHATAAALPVRGAAFLGRHAELAALTTLLQRHRAVTVTGTGGIGKTRVALELAIRAGAEFADDVRFVDFAACGEPATALLAVADAFEIPTQGRRDLLAAVEARFRARDVLLVFDNCEHVIDEIARISAALVRSADASRILTTSREPMGIEPEAVFALPPMAVPPEETPLHDLARFDSVALFVDRARSAIGEFELRAANAKLISDTCRRLEGIPLAIELAAAGLATLGLEELHARLDDQLALLRSHRRDVMPRQRTLAATIAWSYELLDACERLTLQRLSVFPGRWRLNAAGGICADEQVSEHAIVGAVSSLVAKSLVATERRGSGMYYRLLESTRRFARERLALSGDDAAVVRRHAHWVAAVADEAASRLHRVPMHEWVESYDGLLDSARAAVEWATSTDDNPALAARILVGLRMTWIRKAPRELRHAGRLVLERLSDADATIAAKLCVTLLQIDRDWASFSELMERAIPLLERANDRRGLRLVHYLAGNFSLILGRIDAAVASFAAGLDDREPGDALLDVMLICGSTYAAIEQGRHADADALLDRASSLVTTLDDETARGALDVIRGTILFSRGEVAAARSVVEAIASRGDFASNPGGPEVALLLLTAAIHVALGESAEAVRQARAAANRSSNSDPYFLFCALYHCAAGLALGGDLVRAAEMLGHLESVASREGWHTDFTARHSEAVLRRVLQNAGTTELRDALERGRYRSPEDFVEAPLP